MDAALSRMVLRHNMLAALIWLNRTHISELHWDDLAVSHVLEQDLRIADYQTISNI